MVVGASFQLHNNFFSFSGRKRNESPKDLKDAQRKSLKYFLVENILNFISKVKKINFAAQRKDINFIFFFTFRKLLKDETQ